jgi:hypothetical protein
MRRCDTDGVLSSTFETAGTPNASASPRGKGGPVRARYLLAFRTLSRGARIRARRGAHGSERDGDLVGDEGA